MSATAGVEIKIEPFNSCSLRAAGSQRSDFDALYINIYTHIYIYIYTYVHIYIYISADLFQSESVLAYIVINQYFAILQTPISHYCNTLQSLILQTAIYLYCRVQLSDCSILKGVG